MAQPTDSIQNKLPELNRYPAHKANRMAVVIHTKVTAFNFLVLSDAIFPQFII